MNIQFQLPNHGFEVHPQACPAPVLAQLQAAFYPNAPALIEQTTTGILYQTAAAILGENCFPTLTVLYDENSPAIPWQQDNPDHADRKLIVRLSLDPCSFFDGALKLCPSSHKHGPLTPQQVRAHSSRPFSSPEMTPGDILIMHPLTIHSTNASESMKPRRVIQIVYAAAELRDTLA